MRQPRLARALPPIGWSVLVNALLAITTPLRAQTPPKQEPEPKQAPGQEQQQQVDERRQRLLELLTEPDAARAARLREFQVRLHQSLIPMQTTTALVVMPQAGDVLQLGFAGGRLELRRHVAGEPTRVCGHWSPTMPGSFVARAFGPHTILIAMQTGNATSQLTVAWLSRPDVASDFDVAALATVGRVTWIDPVSQTEEGHNPDQARVVAWQAESRTATMAFAWPGTARVAFGTVELASTAGDAATPALRVFPPPSYRTVAADAIGTGIDADAIDVDGLLHVVLSRPPDLVGGLLMRELTTEGEAGSSQPAADPDGVPVEPGYCLWRDAEGRVCVTTPASRYENFDVADPTSGRPVQMLRTYRLDPANPAKWTLSPQQFSWSGQLVPGQPLCVTTPSGRAPEVVLQTMTGEVVVQPLDAPQPK